MLTFMDMETYDQIEIEAVSSAIRRSSCRTA